MPQLYLEHLYYWGYAAFALCCFVVCCIALCYIVLRHRTLGIWTLVIGAMLFTMSHCLGSLSWLILSGGESSFDGLKYRRQSDIWGAIVPWTEALYNLGIANLAISMVLLGRDLHSKHISSALIEEGEPAGAAQPASKPADKPPSKVQPPTPTPNDGHR